MTERTIQPHPALAAYYSSLQERPDFVRTLFNRTAADYDLTTRMMSFGCGGLYRQGALSRAGLRAGARVLDVAVGTGQVAREAIRICGSQGQVIGIDRSENMLAVARRSLGITVIQGEAENLPLADASVDFVSMGYALRHVSCLRLAFEEFNRVLRPGGRLLILEFGQPSSAAGRALARLYLSRIVPALCRPLTASDRAGELYRYCWDTIQSCVPAPIIISALADAGFTAPDCTSSMGILAAYTAGKLPA